MRNENRSRSWQWWARELERAGNALPVYADWPESELPIVVRNPDPAAQAEATAAVELFSRRGFWPTLSEPASTNIDLRVGNAIWLCDAWSKAKRPVQPETFPEVFRWLLTECWNVSGADWADAVAEADLIDSREESS
jgi:hypothetical protein